MPVLKPITRGFLFGAIVVVIVAAYGIYSLSHLTPGHVIRINHKDPKLQAAIDQARSTLDGFIKELASPKPDEGFAVKGSFETDAGPEYLWVRKPEFKGGVFSGVLDQQPIALTGKSKGDPISFAKKDAVDWLIKDAQGMRGAYTEKVLGGG